MTEKVRLLNISILFSALSFAGATLLSGAAGHAQGDEPSHITRDAAIKKEIEKNLGAESSETEVPDWRFFISAKQIKDLKTEDGKVAGVKALKAFDKAGSIPTLTAAFTAAQQSATSAIFKSTTAATDGSDSTSLLSYMRFVTDDDDADDTHDAFRAAYREAAEGTPAAYFDISAAGSGINTDTTMADLAEVIRTMVNEQGGTLTDFIAQKTADGAAAGTLATKTAELGNAFDALHYPTDDSLTTGADLTARRGAHNTDYTAYTDKKTPYQTAYMTALGIASDDFNEITAEARSGEIKASLTGLDPDSTVPAGALHTGGNYGGLTKTQLVDLLDNQQKHYEFAELQQAARAASTEFAAARLAGTTHNPPASGATSPEVFRSFENFRELSDANLARFFGHKLHDETSFTAAFTGKQSLSVIAAAPRANAGVEKLIRLAGAPISTSETIPDDDSGDAPISYVETPDRDSTVQQVYTELNDVRTRLRNAGPDPDRTVKRKALKNAFVVLQRAGLLTDAAGSPTDAVGADGVIATAVSRIERGSGSNADKARRKTEVLNNHIRSTLAQYEGIIGILERFVKLPAVPATSTPEEDATATKGKDMEWLSAALTKVRDSSAFANLGSTLVNYNRFITPNANKNQLRRGNKVSLTNLKTGLTNAAAIESLVTAINDANLPDAATLTNLLDLVAKYDEYAAALQAFKDRYPETTDDGTPITEPNNADLITAIATLQTALSEYDTAAGTKTTTANALNTAKGLVETILENLSGSTDLDVDEVATAKLKEDLKAILALLVKMEGDGDDDDTDIDESLTFAQLLELARPLNTAKTDLEEANQQRRNLVNALGGKKQEDITSAYETLLSELVTHVKTVQNRLTEFALLDTLWQHSAMTGTNGLSLEIDGSASWLTHWLNGGIGNVALTGNYRSGNFHVNLTGSYSVSSFQYGLENIKWVPNDLAAGILKLGYHSNIGFRGNAYLSGGTTILNKAGKWMYGIGGHLAYAIWFQDFQQVNFSISLTPSLQIDSAFTRVKAASGTLGYAKAELGLNTGFHVVIDPTVWELSVTIPIKGSVAGNYHFDKGEAQLPPMIGLTTGLNFSVTYSDYATVDLGYGFSTSGGISDDKVTLIYFKHTGRLGFRLDI